jgi:hypothetical protein
MYTLTEEEFASLVALLGYVRQDEARDFDEMNQNGEDTQHHVYKCIKQLDKAVDRQI